MKKRELFKNILLFLTSLFICFILWELVLRFSDYGNLIIYEPHPKLYWKSEPNQDCYTKIDHKPIHVNSHGTRGEDFKEDKPNDVFRVLCLGDSKTFGWGLTEDESYSGLLEQSLQEAIGDSQKVEVINAGVTAWSYSQIFVYLRDIGIKYDPDLVILADANLWTQFSENNNQEFIDGMMKKVWLKNLVRKSAIYHFVIEVKLKKYYYKYRKKFIAIDPEKDNLFKEQQQSDPYLFIRQEIAKFGQLLKEKNIKGMLIYIPEEYRLTSDNHNSKLLSVKQDISESMEMPLIDFTKYFIASQDKLFLEGDPIHPNAKGNKIIAERLHEYIVSNYKSL